MYKYSNKSLKFLYECHTDLQNIMCELIKIYDVTIICGHRGEEEQNKLFLEGRSKLKFPNSNHNSRPALAIDVVPYPIDWDDLNRFYFMSGIIKSISANLGLKVRWGGDWNNNNSFKDQSFNDLPHFELITEV